MGRIVAVLAAVATGLLALGAVPAAAKRPNIVLVVADDQPASAFERMPWLSGQDDWHFFDRSYVNQAWCCPSRASILTGQYSHHHGVMENTGFRFDPSKTLATWLNSHGYRTGLFGKYLNDFPWERGNHVPPGWERWVSFLNVNGAYYDYRVGINGAKTPDLGGRPRDYSTDFFARRAMRFAAGAPQPFFAMVAPFAPHDPAIPARRHQGAFAGVDVPKPPNFGEVAPDQPRHYRNLKKPGWSPTERKTRRAWTAALAVDDMVRRLVATLRRRGALDRTVFVYVSDNGLSDGSHRHRAKNCLYQECVRVPLAIRTPGGVGENVPTPVSNVDLASTLTDFANRQPSLRQDGRSLMPELLGQEPWPDDRNLLLEVHRSKQGVPDGYAVVNSNWKYARHETGERELYNLNTDPYELDNKADEPAYDLVEQRLAERLAKLRSR